VPCWPSGRLQSVSRMSVSSVAPHDDTSSTTEPLPAQEELFNSADDDFFHRVKTNTNHVIQPHLPDNTDLPYQLRTRSHNMTLINKTKLLTSDDFLIRMLYKYSY